VQPARPAFDIDEPLLASTAANSDPCLQGSVRPSTLAIRAFEDFGTMMVVSCGTFVGPAPADRALFGQGEGEGRLQSMPFRSAPSTHSLFMHLLVWPCPRTYGRHTCWSSDGRSHPLLGRHHITVQKLHASDPSGNRVTLATASGRIVQDRAWSLKMGPRALVYLFGELAVGFRKRAAGVSRGLRA